MMMNAFLLVAVLINLAAAAINIYGIHKYNRKWKELERELQRMYDK